MLYNWSHSKIPKITAILAVNIEPHRAAMAKLRTQEFQKYCFQRKLMKKLIYLHVPFL